MEEYIATTDEVDEIAATFTSTSVAQHSDDFPKTFSESIIVAM